MFIKYLYIYNKDRSKDKKNTKILSGYIFQNI